MDGKQPARSEMENDRRICPEHSGFLKQLNSLEKEIELRFSALEKMTSSTKADLEKRLETMNEFRAQLDNQAKTFISKSEVELKFTARDKKIERLVDQTNTIKNWLIGLLVTVIINLIGVITLLILRLN